MNDHVSSDTTSSRTILKPRRLALLGTVAALGVAVLAGSPASSSLTSFIAPAQAAETVATPPGFGDLVSKVKPAVISVRVRIDQDNDKSAMLQQNRMDSDEDSPFDQFSRQFGFRGPGGMNGIPRQRHQMITGEGSGFFISADGYAVTNNHVVDHAASVQVTMDDGAVYTAKVVGTDPKTDLALIKVDGKKDFPFVKFSDQKPRIGDWVVAVGNPFGLGGTVTAGIVSASGRDIGNGPYDDFIQIDAPINKGNSGGPAFDMNGNVIGVNTAIFSPSGGSVGIGFDIPASTAKLVVAQLKDKGAVTRGWLGVQVQPVTADIADSLGLKDARGAIVDNPQDGSPAAKAGIEAGDVITAVNGASIKDSRDLAQTIATLAPGSSVKLDVFHKGDSKTVTLALGELPNEQQAKASEGRAQPGAGTPRLGLSLAPAGDVQGAGQKGVVVTEVDPQGPAAQRGIQTGDVILNVGGKPVANVGEVRSELAQAKSSGKNSVLLQVKSAEATRFVAVPLA
ncbi:Do family serine endopeptidase [Bradyrhizobium diazoefficiens]|nr:Do family serine endopeptidase [Bradyrhizobium diazoefficiens]UCF55420.1 MAG: Do family serine endopeptidase [Bradyrhizobium sp.]MBR0966620.1 Do family serine endopeptidase [Bradyrhizobium diazoefficiens]MBR0980371.1 Do family serine endopeptidase [Bradyrhizobium diazoefficiens]MBR1009719.1 Do family serine endopeptidase [Bradyrhizobium diazoefficiens]MBR1016302.1 Do family serine endopeptidase [Bradyrhizobium diazoefficiens]